MSARAFLERYAERSGMTPAALLEAGRVVVPCDCPFEWCEGWAVVPADDVYPWAPAADLCIGSEVLPWCGHRLRTGIEGPVPLGAQWWWPVVWKCCACGHVEGHVLDVARFVVEWDL